MVSPNLVQFWEAFYLFSHICPHLQYTTNQVNLLWAPDPPLSYWDTKQTCFKPQIIYYFLILFLSPPFSLCFTSASPSIFFRFKRQLGMALFLIIRTQKLLLSPLTRQLKLQVRGTTSGDQQRSWEVLIRRSEPLMHKKRCALGN